MIVKKLPIIKKYKSFQNYYWQTFLNTETFHPEMNILFGENGSGKSSVCNILKSVSDHKDFIRYFPEGCELKVDNSDYSYSNRTWSSKIPKGSILFFDREFVENNVHLGRDRGTQQGEQEQSSGKLIIEFDSEAIRLRDIREKLSIIREQKDADLQKFRQQNKTSLDFELDEDEEKLFKRYKNKNDVAIAKDRETLDGSRSDLERQVKEDRKLLQKTIDIQAIPEIENNEDDAQISAKKDYQDLFAFDLKEQTRVSAESSLIEKLRDHKAFFEKGFDIRKQHPNECPFCQAKDQEEGIRNIIKIYNGLYDDTYRKRRQIFESTKEALIEELKAVEDTLKEFDLNTIFIKLKKLSEQYGINGLYVVSEEELYRNLPPSKKVVELRKKIEALEKPNKDDVSSLYAESLTEVEGISKFFSNLRNFVNGKNRIIRSFKKEHTNAKLVGRIEKNESSVANLKIELDFITGSKIEKKKSAIEKLKLLKKLNDAFEKAKEAQKDARESYETYCSTGAFPKILSKIESYFNNFSFSFKLKLATGERHTSSTKELPFAFKIVDLDENERDLKEGLSEGEMQVLSLCFFFAFLDIQSDKNKKVLVFDDPITSLDDSNLSSLVDLIATENDKFSQTFVFSHHRTFFKFLRKKFNNKCHEYNIIRNKNHLGGSFICKSQEERFVEALKNFETHLTQVAQNPNGFDVELKIIEYGQLLRYETEHFIKCRLLHWNDAGEFAKVVEGVKENKKVTNDDLDKIKQIYSFCNWTTSHVDVGDDHGLSQLKEKVSDFVTISQRY